MHNKQIKLGIILQYLQMAFSVLINLVYTPIMLSILGKTEYGIYNVASSLITYLGLLSLGFGASYIRFYSKNKSEGDYEAIKCLNGLYLFVYFVMGTVAMCCGLFISFHIEVFFNETYSKVDLQTAKILMVFLAINLFFSFIGSVFNSYIASQERFIFQKLINCGKTVLSPILSIAVLYIGFGSIGMVFVTTIISILVDLVNFLYCKRALDMKFAFKVGSLKNLKPIATFSIFIAINQLIDQLNWQTDKVIIGKYIDGAAVAIYAVGATINSMYIQVSIAISGVFAPRIHSIVNSGALNIDDQLTNLMIKVGRMQFYILSLVCSGFVFFGKYFINVWAGEDFDAAYIVVLLLIIPGTISLCQSIGVEIQRAKNMHKFRSIAYLIMAVLNILMSLAFVKLWGIIGCALGTTISLVVGNGIIMNWYYKNKIGIDIRRFWMSILSIFRGMLLPIVVGFVLNKIGCSSILVFSLDVLIYSLTFFVSMLFFSFNDEERNEVRKILKRVRLIRD